MLLAKSDEVIKTLAADALDPTLGVRIQIRHLRPHSLHFDAFGYKDRVEFHRVPSESLQNVSYSFPNQFFAAGKDMKRFDVSVLTVLVFLCASPLESKAG